MEVDNRFRNQFDALMEEAHLTAVQKGWWNPAKSFGEQCIMMVTELAEAVEEYRSSKDDITHIYHSHPIIADELGIAEDVSVSKPEGVPIELADLAIRLFDTCAFYGIDLFSAIEMKMEYNKTRSQRHGNKKL